MRHSFTLMTFSHIVASRLTVAQHPCDNGSCLGLRHGRYLSGRLQPAGTADTTRSYGPGCYRRRTAHPATDAANSCCQARHCTWITVMTALVTVAFHTPPATSGLQRRRHDAYR